MHLVIYNLPLGQQRDAEETSSTNYLQRQWWGNVVDAVKNLPVVVKLISTSPKQP